MTERWLPIEGHPGYEVSDLGRVRSLDRAIVCTNGVRKVLKGKILAFVFRNGYHAVCLGAGHPKYVHRLVASAFLGLPDLDKQVNHKDGRKANNVPSNLEWVTLAENNRHAFTLPRKHPGLTKAVLVDGIRYASQTAAAQSIGCTVSNVGKAAKRGWKCKGKDVVYG